MIKDQTHELESRKKGLTTKIESWENSLTKLQHVQPETPIKLNVGGKYFSTSLTTLQSYESSFFGALVSGRWEVKKQEDGAIFIDRNPAVFEYVPSR